MTNESIPSLIQLNECPFALFEKWLGDARKSEPNDANAMALATCTRDGHPSVRMVLLKGTEHNAFTFYTNLESRKGVELRDNPRAALAFHWKTLRRQVRVEGVVEQVTDAQADRYFASRSRESRLSALASDQSRPLLDRSHFEKRLKDLDLQYAHDEPIRPANWSGFQLNPEKIEFWRDRPHRAHDRVLWTRKGSDWLATRLYP